jgi:uncharacterized protein YbjQ (UPF0145 family)
VSTWGSALTADEFAVIRSAGFEPVGQVFGAAVYGTGSASTSGCPGSFAAQVQAMYQARRAALDRMTAECARLGGHGVVGVRLSMGDFLLGGLEFMVIGTAVRASGVAVEPPSPFTSDVSGQDFAKLIMTGWVPVGLALGVSIGSRHDDRPTTRQARWLSGNAEVTGWAELVTQSRTDARRELENDVRRLGAEGVVIATMRMRVRQRDCPVIVGRRDHIVEAILIGTAIARFGDVPPGEYGAFGAGSTRDSARGVLRVR